MKKRPAFDFALSFAGENRDVASKLAHLLSRSGARVFYDDDFRPFLLGKRLTKEFQKIYGSSTKHVVPIISRYYPEKDWNEYEFSIVKKERRKRKADFVLPVRLDKTKILGLPDDLGYIDLQKMSLSEATEILLAKIGLDLIITPEWWAVGYAVDMDEFNERAADYSIPPEMQRDEYSIKEWLIPQLKEYLNSTGVEYRLLRDLGEESKSDDSLGVWVLLHWDPTTSPFPLQSHDPWELTDFDTYQNVFQKEEPDEDEGE